MKKIFTFILIISLLLLSNSQSVNAESLEKHGNAEIIYCDSDIIIEQVTVEYIPTLQLFSTNSSKSASTTLTIKNSNNTAIATFTLSASFTYNGKTAKCTSSTCSSSIIDSSWSFISENATKSGAAATAYFTLKRAIPYSTISDSVILKCSKDGTITS